MKNLILQLSLNTSINKDVMKYELNVNEIPKYKISINKSEKIDKDVYKINTDVIEKYKQKTITSKDLIFIIVKENGQFSVFEKYAGEKYLYMEKD